MSAKISNEKERKIRPFEQRLFRKPDGKIRYQFPLHTTPVINMLYDIFFDDTVPKFESCKSLLDVLGLLSALLLASVSGLIGAVSFNDCVEADKRLYFGPQNSTYVKYWRTYYTRPPSAQFYFNTTNAASIFFIVLLMVVFIYVDGVGKVEQARNKKDLDKEQQAQSNPSQKTKETEEANEETEKRWQKEEIERNEKLFAAWWSAAKFSVLLVVLMTVAGCTFCVLSIGVIYIIKYPDYHIEATGRYVDNASDSPTVLSNSTFKTLFVTCAIICAFSCGLGTARKYNLEDMWEEEEFLEKEEKRKDKEKQDEFQGSAQTHQPGKSKYKERNDDVEEF